MDHDLLMIIYGALIGLGSSLITALFQSWINRRDLERQRKVDRKREQQNIQIPTTDEIMAIRNGKYPTDKGTIIKAVVQAPPEIIPPEFKLILPILLLFCALCVGILSFIKWINSRDVYLIFSAFSAYMILYVIVKTWRAL